MCSFLMLLWRLLPVRLARWLSMLLRLWMWLLSLRPLSLRLVLLRHLGPLRLRALLLLWHRGSPGLRWLVLSRRRLKLSLLLLPRMLLLLPLTWLLLPLTRLLCSLMRLLLLDVMRLHLLSAFSSWGLRRPLFLLPLFLSQLLMSLNLGPMLILLLPLLP